MAKLPVFCLCTGAAKLGAAHKVAVEDANGERLVCIGNVTGGPVVVGPVHVIVERNRDDLGLLQHFRKILGKQNAGRLAEPVQGVAPAAKGADDLSMSKRGAGTELNKDNYEREIEREGTLAQRKIRKAKRPSQRSEGAAELASAAPKANPFANVQLVAPPTSAPAGGFSFGGGGGAAAPSAAPAAAPFSFGAAGGGAPAPTFSFGGAPSAAKPAEAKPAAGGFSFGGGAAPATTPVFGAAPATS